MKTIIAGNMSLEEVKKETLERFAEELRTYGIFVLSYGTFKLIHRNGGGTIPHRNGRIGIVKSYDFVSFSPSKELIKLLK